MSGDRRTVGGGQIGPSSITGARHLNLFFIAVLSWYPGWWSIPSTLSAADPPRMQRGEKSAPRTDQRPKQTSIEFELLMSDDRAVVQAQNWAQLFETLEVEMRTRRATPDEKSDLREKDFGNLRRITVVAWLDRQGKIHTPDRSFGTADGARLKEWLTELKTYGVQGAPQGKPMWGLSEAQFTQFYEAVCQPCKVEVADLPIREAVRKLPLPEKYPVRWTTAAETRVKDLQLPTVHHQVQGFTTATALAIALNDIGLGFKPGRTQAGTLEIVIDVLNDQAPSERTEVWPIGWPLKQQQNKAFPKLFEFAMQELEPIPVADFLEAVQGLAEVPVIVDLPELDRRKLDLTKIKASFPRRYASWSLMLKSICASQRLSCGFVQDEAGRPFLMISSIKAVRPTKGD